MRPTDETVLRLCLGSACVICLLLVASQRREIFFVTAVCLAVCLAVGLAAHGVASTTTRDGETTRADVRSAKKMTGPAASFDDRDEPGLACSHCESFTMRMLMAIQDRPVTRDHLFVCAACEAGLLRSRREESWRDADDGSYETWDVELWFDMDRGDMARILELPFPCPTPLRPGCECRVHQSLRASRESLRGDPRPARNDVTVEVRDHLPHLRRRSDAIVRS